MKLPKVMHKWLSSLLVGNLGWRPWIHEPYSGAWQNGEGELNTRDTGATITNSAVFACATMISADVGRLPLRLMQLSRKHAGIWHDATYSTPATGADYAAVLRRPNGYQTGLQFIESWVSSLMTSGNAYVVLDFALRGIVRQMHVLHPSRVTPRVSPDGLVVYQIEADNLSGVQKQVIVPAEGLIHDRINALHHPLCGLSPIVACALTAAAGNAALRNSFNFFANMSRPGGIMTAPGAISNETAERVKNTFQGNFSGKNIGNLLVLGDGLKYEAMSIAAKDAQLAEQLGFAAVDVARAFRVPPHMIGAAPAPANHTIEQLQLQYYSSVLGSLIEGVEACLDAGLGLPPNMRTEFDLDALLRADVGARFSAYREAVGAGWMSPNEVRLRENLPPVTGGDTPYLQVQNYSLEALGKRDAKADPFESGADKAAKQDAGTRMLALRLEQDRMARESMRGGSARPSYETRDAVPSMTSRRALVAARRREVMRKYFEEQE